MPRVGTFVTRGAESAAPCTARSMDCLFPGPRISPLSLMPFISPQALAAQWWRLQQSESPDNLKRVQALGQDHAAQLATHFYDVMLEDEAASKLLNHEQVRTRLHQSMTNWVASVLSIHDQAGLEKVVNQQIHVGQVHARLDVPMFLVLRGVRSLKQGLAALLRAQALLNEGERLQAMYWAFCVVDFCMEIMGQAYHRSHDSSSKAQEAYRLHAATYSVGAERERQRAALLDWENQLLFDQASGSQGHPLGTLSSSEFGLWFRHKGAHAFAGAPESQQILEIMDGVDKQLLPRLGLAKEAGERLDGLRDLRERTRTLAMLLDGLFEQSRDADAGRDVLTNLLNRKFLPVILNKEVAYCREKRSSFALLAIDVDHFKRINDEYGHEAGDAVLQQLAVGLSHACRGGDYVFRLGGEEFLMLLVDVQQDKAMVMARRVHDQVQSEPFQLPSGRKIHVTVSIGLALHDGHPDYQHTLRRADAALYEAKRNGRNQVVKG